MEQHILFKIRELSYLATRDEPRASCHARRRRPIFGFKLEAWRKCFTFLTLQSETVLRFREHLMPSPVIKVALFQCLSC